jgi:hypothetical protein
LCLASRGVAAPSSTTSSSGSCIADKSTNVEHKNGWRWVPTSGHEPAVDTSSSLLPVMLVCATGRIYLEIDWANNLLLSRRVPWQRQATSKNGALNLYS